MRRNSGTVRLARQERRVKPNVLAARRALSTCTAITDKDGGEVR
jgi:hypothetical protein